MFAKSQTFDKRGSSITIGQKMKIPFQVSARAGKLLGRENFSNPEGAIIELVKNTYDADAENCIVIFDIPTEEREDKNGKIIRNFIQVQEKGSIYIIDNGTGMKRQAIENNWMQIGTGNKEIDFMSEKERVKTGAKGIGRFALDRLGGKTELWTKSKNESQDDKSLNWQMDWTQFDSIDKNISEISANLEEITIPDFKERIVGQIGENLIGNLLDEIDLPHGTLIKISNLKDEWGEDDLKRVFAHLESLVPPDELNIPFKVKLTHLQNRPDYGDVRTSFFNDFDYKLSAKFDSKKCEVVMDFTRDELDFEVFEKQYGHLFQQTPFPFDIATIRNKSFSYTKSIGKLLNWDLSDEKREILSKLGDFNFGFHFVKYNISRKEGYPYKKINNSKERRTALDRFGGIKVYRDSFRVRPYGDPTNDWLNLGSRMSKSPAGPGQRIGDWRVGRDNISGIVTISRKNNPLLEDKSDRGGIQENEVFQLFKNIIIAIVHEFEVDRTRILNPIYNFEKQKETEKTEEKLNEMAKKLAKKIVEERKNENTGTNSSGEEAGYEEFIKETLHEAVYEEDNRHAEELAQIRSLASLGLIVASFSHELKEVGNNATEINALEKLFFRLLSAEKIGSTEHLDAISIFKLLKSDKEKIKHWVDYALNTIKKDKRTRTKLDFSVYFENLQDSWSKVFKRRDIDLKLIDGIQGNEYAFKAFEMDMNTVFSNLISNSIDSFDKRKSVGERKISIEYRIVGRAVEIIYSDNGDGLGEVFENKEDIFLPFTTSKKDKKGNEIGTGLGMYLVKSVIDDNEGTVEILNPEIGFAMKLSLPLINN